MTQGSEGKLWTGDDLLDDLRRAIDGDLPSSNHIDAQLDTGRHRRIGTPEIILAETKLPEQVVRLARDLVERSGRALVSRLTPPILDAIEDAFDPDQLEHPPGSRMVRIINSESSVESDSKSTGRVAILTAGTSDVPHAREVELVVQEMGSSARVWTDMGVAGLHRLVEPFREAINWPADVFVVVAGMDGALPSVVSGLAPIPVIGLPVSVGYGHGGAGEAALLSMLQTCAPGLTVVNIDNTVGAGIAAARIARQSAT
jgi:pyridinium-3,5-biscarboxylic acid mononucleotide synthase